MQIQEETEYDSFTLSTLIYQNLMEVNVGLGLFSNKNKSNLFANVTKGYQLDLSIQKKS